MICPSFDEHFSHQLCHKCLQRKTPHTDPISDRRVWAPCPACCVEAPSPGPSSARPSKGSLKTLCPQPPSEREAELRPECGRDNEGRRRRGEGSRIGWVACGTRVLGEGQEAWVFISALNSLCDLKHIAFPLSEAQLHLMPEDDAPYLSWSFIHSFADSFVP